MKKSKIAKLIVRSAIKYKAYPRTNHHDWTHSLTKEDLEDFLEKKIGEKSQMTLSNAQLEKKNDT